MEIKIIINGTSYEGIKAGDYLNIKYSFSDTPEIRLVVKTFNNQYSLIDITNNKQTIVEFENTRELIQCFSEEGLKVDLLELDSYKDGKMEFTLIQENIGGIWYEGN